VHPLSVMGMKSPMKTLDLGIWLALKVGHAKAARLIKQAKGWDKNARNQLDELFRELWADIPSAVRLVEGLDPDSEELPRLGWIGPDGRELVDPRPSLSLDLADKRPQGRPPIASLAKLTLELACGPPGSSRPTVGGDLKDDLSEVRDIITDLVHSWRAFRSIPTLEADRYDRLKIWLPAVRGDIALGEDISAPWDTGLTLKTEDGIEVPFVFDTEEDVQFLQGLLKLGAVHRPPADLRIAESSRSMQYYPAWFAQPVRSSFWRWVSSALPPTKAAYSILGDLLTYTPEQVQRAAGSGGSVSTDSGVRYFVEEGPWCRVIRSLPSNAGPKNEESVVTWTRAFVKGLSRVHWITDENGERQPRLVDWDELATELPGHLGDRWSVHVNQDARVIWIYYRERTDR
jgi:hypothetical protein